MDWDATRCWPIQSMVPESEGEIPEIQEIVRTKNLDLFKRILEDEGLRPLLIEFSVKHDPRNLFKDTIDRFPIFTSVLTSYFDPVLSEDETLLNAWKEVIRILTEDVDPKKPLRTKEGKLIEDIIPNLKTYEQVFAFSYVDKLAWDKFTQLPEEIVPYYPSETTKPQSKEFMPKRLPLNEERASLTDVLDHIGESLRNNISPEAKNLLTIQNVLQCAAIVVVPFSRLIKVYEADDIPEYLTRSGKPGGCLTALIVPDAHLINADKELTRLSTTAEWSVGIPSVRCTHLRRAAVRISWVMHKAAILEGGGIVDREEEQSRFIRGMLENVSHTVKVPAHVAADNLSQVRHDLEELNQQSKGTIPERILKSLTIAENETSGLRSSANAMHLFVNLGLSDQTVQQQHQFIRGYDDGGTTTRIFEVLNSFQNNYYLTHEKKKACSLQVHCDENLDTAIVQGNRDLWYHILFMLLKNAAEASIGTTLHVRFQWENRARKLSKLTIENHPIELPSREQLAKMNLAILKAKRLAINETKTSMGIGLTSVALVLDAWELDDRGFTVIDNSVVLEICGIPVVVNERTS